MKGCMVKLFKGCLITLGAILVAILGAYVYFEWESYRASSKTRVERITGVKIPPYNIIKYDKGKRSFHGDYHDSYVIEFELMPPDELFDEIDKRIASDSLKKDDYGCNGWSREGSDYHFSAMWGNGIPAPEGESDDDDGTFSITITRGERMGSMTCGAW